MYVDTRHVVCVVLRCAVNVLCRASAVVSLHAARPTMTVVYYLTMVSAQYSTLPCNSSTNSTNSSTYRHGSSCSAGTLLYVHTTVTKQQANAHLL